MTKNTVAKVTPADLAFFKKTQELTNAKMCAIFGISTQAKYNKLVTDRNPKTKDLDMSYAFLFRLYQSRPEFTPISNQMSVTDCYEMFLRVFGDEYMNVSTFGEILGRSPGSGYRWIKGNGSTTPQVDRILDRFAAMKNAGWSEDQICRFWIELVRDEFEARGKVFPFDRTEVQRARRKLIGGRGRTPGAVAKRNRPVVEAGDSAEVTPEKPAKGKAVAKVKPVAVKKAAPKAAAKSATKAVAKPKVASKDKPASKAKAKVEVAPAVAAEPKPKKVVRVSAQDAKSKPSTRTPAKKAQ